MLEARLQQNLPRVSTPFLPPSLTLITGAVPLTDQHTWTATWFFNRFTMTGVERHQYMDNNLSDIMRETYSKEERCGARMFSHIAWTWRFERCLGWIWEIHLWAMLLIFRLNWFDNHEFAKQMLPECMTWTTQERYSALGPEGREWVGSGYCWRKIDRCTCVV